MTSYKFFNVAMKRNVALKICNVTFYIYKIFTRDYNRTRIIRALNFRGRRITAEERLKKQLLKQAPDIEVPITEIPKTCWKDMDDNDFFGISSDSGVIIIPHGTVKTTKSGIEKFGYLLKSKGSLNDGDRTFVTNFGTVRFDSDNQPAHSKSNIKLNSWEHIGGPNSIKKFCSLFYPREQTSDEFQSLPADINQNSRQLSSEIDEIYADERHSKVLRSGRPNFIKDELNEMYQVENDMQSNIDICYFGNKFHGIKGENIDVKETAACAVESPSTPTSGNAFQGIAENCDIIEDFYFENNAAGPKVGQNDGHFEMYGEVKNENQSYIDDIYFNELYNSKTYEDLNSSKVAGVFNSVFHFQGKNCDINEFPSEIKNQDFIDTGYFGENMKEMPNSDFKEKVAVLRENVTELSNLADEKYNEPVASNLSDSGIQSYLKENEVNFSDITSVSSQIRRLNSSRNTIQKDTIESSNTSVNSRSNYENQDSAYNYVFRLKNDNKTTASNVNKGVISNVNISGEKLDSKGFRILSTQALDLTNHTRLELLDMMKERILFSNDDIVILDKPYSLIIHESQTTKSPSLSSFLNEFARHLDKSSENPQLYTVHRLDKETTGCLLLARNEKSALYMKSLFANRKISKMYWVVTSKVPEPFEGIIDMPITEGKINNKRRMVLQPDLSADIKYKSHVNNGKRAITNYRVIATSGSAALLEVKPETGLKHQIRVHLGFGLGCPIIGDHKYSCLTKLAPQKLPNDILQMLHVRQSKVRYIPMHIHAKAIVIPDYFEKGRDLYITAPVPKHMRENIRRLKLNKK